jgi:hypothetical protein
MRVWKRQSTSGRLLRVVVSSEDSLCYLLPLSHP